MVAKTTTDLYDRVMNFSNPFQSGRRVFALLVISPAVWLASVAVFVATDYAHYTPEPGEVRLVIEPGWPR